MSTSKLKIQINNLEALERLIGGDSEIEIEIRNNIVQEFSKKHLKAIAESSVMKGAEKDIKKYSDSILAEIKNRIGTKPRCWMSTDERNKYDAYINGIINNDIFDRIKSCIDDKADIMLDELMKRLDKYILDVIESQYTYQLCTLAKQGVSEEINKIFNILSDKNKQSHEQKR